MKMQKKPRERPLLFNAPMVRAILEDHKSMTRRTHGLNEINKEPDRHEFRKMLIGDPAVALFWDRQEQEFIEVNCPCGKPGGHLWVRETWGAPDADHPRCVDGRKPKQEDKLVYLANPADAYQWGSARPSQGDFCWRPSIHMPRWASRILLEITDIRIERLQDISEEDAIREGCAGVLGPNLDFPDEWDPSPQEEFRDLWMSIRGPDSWNTNPFVWKISFRRLRP